VPAEPEEDGIEWDVEDEDQDVVKQEKIKSTSSAPRVTTDG
jgi:hypothetical protein